MNIKPSRYQYQNAGVRLVGTCLNANTLGAIVCDFKGNEVNVGSGFTDEQREYYYNNPNEIIGKIVEVKYKEVSKFSD